jgi:phosphoglycolate phosphatase
MKLTDKKYLIFDFDETIDTLVIDWEIWKQGMNDIIQRYDPTGSIAFSLEKSDSLENYYLEKFGEKINHDFIEFKRDFENKYLQGHTPNQAAVNFIKKADGFTILMWTGNHRDTVRTILAELGIAEKIKKIVGRENVKFIKPNPDGFTQLFVPGSEKKDYLMIGNSSADSGAAKAVGIDFIHVDDFVRLIKE